MIDYPSLSEERDVAPKPGHAWITRHGRDAYFLATASVAALIGSLACQSSTRVGIRAIGGPASLAMIWAIIRWSWPRSGMAVPTLSGTPGAIPILWWLATWGLLLGLGGAARFCMPLFRCPSRQNHGRFDHLGSSRNVLVRLPLGRTVSYRASLPEATAFRRSTAGIIDVRIRKPCD